MTDSPNVALVRAVYASFLEGDLPRLIEVLDPATVWTLHGPKEHPFAGTWRGVGEVARFLQKVGETVEVVALDVEEVLDAGGAVVGIGREKGKSRRTGKAYEVRWIHVFRVRDGKIAAFEEWYDTATVLAALER